MIVHLKTFWIVYVVVGTFLSTVYSNNKQDPRSKFDTSKLDLAPTMKILKALICMETSLLQLEKNKQKINISLLVRASDQVHDYKRGGLPHGCQITETPSKKSPDGKRALEKNVEDQVLDG